MIEADTALALSLTPTHIHTCTFLPLCKTAMLLHSHTSRLAVTLTAITTHPSHCHQRHHHITTAALRSAVCFLACPSAIETALISPRRETRASIEREKGGGGGKKPRR